MAVAAIGKNMQKPQEKKTREKRGGVQRLEKEVSESDYNSNKKIPVVPHEAVPEVSKK